MIKISQAVSVFVLSLFLFLAISFHGQATCPCSGNYNFLGDPETDINMASYDEFVGSNAAASSVSSSPIVQADQGTLILSLQDKTQIDVALHQEKGDLIGQGNLTRQNETEPVQAKGSLKGNNLALVIVSPHGESYLFDLAKEGGTVLGDFNLTTPSGEKISGIADGRWQN